MINKQWAKIDRKPNEFKAGDIIRRSQGEYVEVREVSKSGKTLQVLSNMGLATFKSSQCDLICPREWRFD